ncbi:MAG: hypothetical protein MR816_04220 [Blautia sp.]|nr:hypothetical protein [Blautia sp.]
MNLFLYGIALVIGVAMGCVAFEFGLVDKDFCKKTLLSLFRALKKAASFLYELFYEELKGEPLPDKVRNISYLLTDQEALELVSTLSGHPYDTPTLASYSVDGQGIAWYDIHAVGLAPAYKECPPRQVARICSHLVQNFFMESRGTQIALYLKVVSPTRLCLAVPLSVSAQRLLEAQTEEKRQGVSPANRDSLTETVPVSGEEDGASDDTRL